jgi:predicted outer membrane repeat protein
MAGALEKWESDLPDCLLIMQLAPGRYHNRLLKIEQLSVLVKACTECPDHVYSEQRPIFELVAPLNLVHAMRSDVTFANISAVGVGRIFTDVIRAYFANVTLLNVSISNVHGSHPVVSISNNSTFTAILSKFESCALTTDEQTTLSVIMTMPSSRLNLESCLFEFNRLIMASSVTNGGSCITSRGTFIMSGSIFRHNTIEIGSSVRPFSLVGGGAVFARTDAETISLSSTLFENNTLPLLDGLVKQTLETYGGGLFIASDSVLVTLSQLEFRSNSALYGGGLAIRSSEVAPKPSAGYIKDCLFEGNLGLSGSALYIERPEDHWKVSDTVFRENVIAETEVSDQRAATVAVLQASKSALYFFEHCTFDGNRMKHIVVGNSKSYGTALSLYTEARLNISNCVFQNHFLPTQWNLPLIVAYYISPSIYIGKNIFVNNSDALISILPGSDQTFLGISGAESWMVDDIDETRANNGIPPYQTEVLIEHNHFDLLLAPYSSEQPKISVSVSARHSGITLRCNTFSASFDPEKGPGAANGHLISATGTSHNLGFWDQEIPLLPGSMQVYVAGISDIYIVECQWRMRLVMQGCPNTFIHNSTFSTPLGPAIEATSGLSIRIRDSKFLYNAASDSGSALKFSKCNAIIDGSQFLHSWSSRRGAIESDEVLTINDSFFFNNTAMLYGGAIWSSKSLIIQNCHFEENLASMGGAIYVAAGRLAADNSTFFLNRAIGQGGAILAESYTKLALSDSIFRKNTAYGQGGAISMASKGDLSAQMVIFDNNRAPQSRGSLQKKFERNIGGASHLTTPLFNAKDDDDDGDDEDPTDNAGGALWLVQAKSLTLSLCNFTYGVAPIGSFIAMQGLPVNMTISRSNFNTTQSSIQGSIAVLPVSSPTCAQAYPENSVRIIEHCQFSDLNVQRGAGIYLNPCEASTPPSFIPLLNMTGCIFAHLSSVQGAAVFIEGAPAPYLNWSNSTIREANAVNGGSLLFYSMAPSLIQSHDRESFILPAGCEGCEIGANVTFPEMASTGYFLAEADPSVPSWIIDKHVLSIDCYDLYDRVGSSQNLQVNLEFTTSDPSRINVFGSDAAVTVPRTVPISLNVSNYFAKPSIYLGTSQTRELMIAMQNEPLFQEIEVYVHLASRSPSLNLFIQPNFTTKAKLIGCFIGDGIRAHSSLENTYSCDVCPVGSYNLVPSGSCYLCNDPTATIQKASCVGSKVTGTNGYYTGFELDEHGYYRSNLIWTHTCNYKFCVNPTIMKPCEETRQGYMCADCVRGKNESLMWSLCGSCAADEHDTAQYRTPASFIAFSVFLWLFIVALVHLAIHRHFFVSLTGLLAAQQLMIYPRQYISTVLPHGLPRAIVRWTCIAPATAISRSTIFAPMAPVIVPIVSAIAVSILLLMLNGIYLSLAKLRKRQFKDSKADESSNPLLSSSNTLVEDSLEEEPVTNLGISGITSINAPLRAKRHPSELKLNPDWMSSKPSCTSIGSACMTFWAFSILTVAPVIQSVIEFQACEPASMNRLLWKVAPSVSCLDPVFVYRKRLSMALGVPWVVLVLTVTAILSWKISAIPRLRAFAERAFTKPKWHPAMWMLTIIFSNVLIGTLTSTSYWYEELASIGVPIAFMLPSGMIMLFAPMKGLLLNGTVLNLAFVGSSISLIAVSLGNTVNSHAVFNEASQLWLALSLLILYLIAAIVPAELLQRIFNS